MPECVHVHLCAFICVHMCEARAPTKGSLTQLLRPAAPTVVTKLTQDRSPLVWPPTWDLVKEASPHPYSIVAIVSPSLAISPQG